MDMHGDGRAERGARLIAGRERLAAQKTQNKELQSAKSSSVWCLSWYLLFVASHYLASHQCIDCEMTLVSSGSPQTRPLGMMIGASLSEPQDKLLEQDRVVSAFIRVVKMDPEVNQSLHGEVIHICTA